jgi:hypothetical protein
MCLVAVEEVPIHWVVVISKKPQFFPARILPGIA